MIAFIEFSKRLELALPGQTEETLTFAADHFVKLAQEAIKKKGAFYVALSGGSTPKAIFHKLVEPDYRDLVDWHNVWLFWSDERAVPHDHPDSNYRMAMESAFSQLPVPLKQIFPMETESKLEEHAKDYERIILETVPGGVFDLIMLGVGEDGHTASLFPGTEALHEHQRLVVPNFVPKLKTWRMTFTFACINRAKKAVFYALGENKAKIVEEIFKEPVGTYPAQTVGTVEHPALWILDRSSSFLLSWPE